MIYCKTFTCYGYFKSRFVKELDCKFQVSTIQEYFTDLNILKHSRATAQILAPT